MTLLMGMPLLCNLTLRNGNGIAAKETVIALDGAQKPS